MSSLPHIERILSTPRAVLPMFTTRDRLSIKMLFYQYRDPHVKDKTVVSLIFKMGIPIPGKDGLYIETGPRFAACTGDIRFPFIKTCNFSIDKNWSVWQIYNTLLFGWNLRICFLLPVFWGAQAFSLKIYCGVSIEPYCVPLYIEDAPKPWRTYAETRVFVIFSGHGRQG